MRRALQTVAVSVDSELAHYTTSTALDAILEWFLDDGYSADEVVALVESRLEELAEA